MKPEKYLAPRKKRDAILRKDASRDLEHEIARHEKEAAEERDLYSQYLSTEQMGDLSQIELAEEEDIDMYVFLLAQERLIARTSNPHSGVLPVETARAHFTADSFYAICKHLTRSGLDTPEVMQYTLNMMDGITDVSSVPLLLSIVEDARYYDEQYEQRGVIERSCRQLCGIMRDIRYEQSIAIRAMVADRMVNAMRARGEREELATVLATTGTVVSLEYFTRRHYRSLGQQQMLALHRGDFSGLDLPEHSRERDRYGYEESYEHDHGFDHYDRWDDESYEGDGEYRHDRNSDDVGFDDGDRHRRRSRHERDEGDSFKGKGLRVSISEARISAATERLLTENGTAEMRAVPVVGLINFTPGGVSYYSPKRRTEFLLTGYDDFKAYFERAKNREIPEADVFEGWTNREMARAALVLGFHIEQGSEGGRYHVIALASEVRDRLTELEQKQYKGKEGFLEKMRRRVDRLEDTYGRAA